MWKHGGEKMSKQRKVHHEVASRQHTYHVARNLAHKFGYRHKPRWRKSCRETNKSARQMTYAMFGPEYMGVERKS